MRIKPQKPKTILHIRQMDASGNINHGIVITTAASNKKTVTISPKDIADYTEAILAGKFLRVIVYPFAKGTKGGTNVARTIKRAAARLNFKIVK
jgi:hypothetical protein